eukprot:9270618-Alexandrium_andersonii.AAC.1
MRTRTRTGTRKHAHAHAHAHAPAHVHACPRARARARTQPLVPLPECAKRATLFMSQVTLTYERLRDAEYHERPAQEAVPCRHPSTCRPRLRVSSRCNSGR